MFGCLASSNNYIIAREENTINLFLKGFPSKRFPKADFCDLLIKFFVLLSVHRWMLERKWIWYLREETEYLRTLLLRNGRHVMLREKCADHHPRPRHSFNDQQMNFFMLSFTHRRWWEEWSFCEVILCASSRVNVNWTMLHLRPRRQIRIGFLITRAVD